MSDHGTGHHETRPSDPQSGHQSPLSEYVAATLKQLRSLQETLEAGARSLQQTFEGQTKGVQEFLTTMAPEIVRTHGVPRKSAITFGIITLIAFLVNFTATIYLGWDQSHNGQKQNALQGIAQRLMLTDILSKQVDALNRTTTDLTAILSAFNQSLSGDVVVYGFGNVPGTSSTRLSWVVSFQNFVGHFCEKTHTVADCRDHDIFDLIKSPSLDLTDGGHLQMAMILRRLGEIDNAVQPLSAGKTDPTTRKSISGILKDARKACKSSSHGGTAILLDDSTKTNITQSAFDSAVTLSTAIDGVINASRPAHACYSRLRPDNPSATESLSCSTDPHETAAQLDSFKEALASLRKVMKDSGNPTPAPRMSVLEFTETVSKALMMVNNNLAPIKADCDQLSVSFTSRLNDLAMKPADFVTLLSQ